MAKNTPCKLCQRWLRTRLRTFLALCLVAGAGSGSLGSYAIAIHGVWQTTADLERQGCMVNSDFQERFGLMPMQRKGFCRPLLEWALSNPDELYLNLARTNVTDQLLSQVADLGRARILELSHTNVTDQGLSLLVRVRGLEEVRLFSTAITDAGLVHLAKLPDLKRLDLSATKVSDEGVKYLAQMSALDDLYLGNTKVSEAGMLALEGSLPHARIHRQVIGCLGTTNLVAESVEVNVML